MEPERAKRSSSERAVRIADLAQRTKEALLQLDAYKQAAAEWLLCEYDPRQEVIDVIDSIPLVRPYIDFPLGEFEYSVLFDHATREGVFIDIRRSKTSEGVTIDEGACSITYYVISRCGFEDIRSKNTPLALAKAEEIVRDLEGAAGKN